MCIRDRDPSSHPPNRPRRRNDRQARAPIEAVGRSFHWMSPALPLASAAAVSSSSSGWRCGPLPSTFSNIGKVTPWVSEQKRTALGPRAGDPPRSELPSCHSTKKARTGRMARSNRTNPLHLARPARHNPHLGVSVDERGHVCNVDVDVYKRQRLRRWRSRRAVISGSSVSPSTPQFHERLSLAPSSLPSPLA